MNDSYHVTNLELAVFVFGPVFVVLLVWLLTPSAAYRVTYRWIQENSLHNTRTWLFYRSFKRFFSPTHIAMNATNNLEFTSDDLNLLNGLFEKLGQPAAEFIRPITGDSVDPNSMEILNAEDVITDQPLVLDVLSAGVRWGRLTLKKASIVQCSPDFLMMHRLMNDDVQDEILSAFLEYYKRQNLLAKGCQLGACELKGFIDTQMRAGLPRVLFDALKKAHPNKCYEVIEPSPGSAFNNNTMVPSAGAVPGQRSAVVEVRRCGIARTRHPEWIIKAVVKI